jgi:uncharacterized protein (DUF2147 family)
MVGKYTLVLLVLIANVSVASDAIEGVWVTSDGDGLIEFQLQDENLSGVIAGSLSDPNRAKPARYDDLNPDPNLRERPLLGLAIVTNLLSSGSNEWKGQVYDPNTGKTYKCTLTLVNADTLKLRGYIGFSLLGKTRVWTRKQSGVTISNS